MNDPASSVGAVGPVPTAPAAVRRNLDVPDVEARLDGIEELGVDTQVALLAGIDADLRAALDNSRG